MLFVGLYEGELEMSIPVLILFVVFFAVLGPVFLYWFSRYIRDPGTERPSFIGFPQDGRTDHAQTPGSQHNDAAQERR
jgi:membrane protein DedA with SNARE-associated domain